jgi:hypothetical protein
LSALIAKNEIECSLIDNGFYSAGAESTSQSLEECWIYTGDISLDRPPMRFGTRIVSICDHYSRKIYDIVKTVFVFPVHLLIYFMEKEWETKS